MFRYNFRHQITKPFFTFLLGALCPTATSYAQDYYFWRHPGTFESFPSPAASCSSNYPSPFASFSHVQFISDTYAICWYHDLRDIGRLLTERKTYRYGSGCKQEKIYNPTKGTCSNDQFKGPQPASNPAACAINKIELNIVTGNKFLIETDIPPTASTLEFSRSFNSDDGNWQHNYSAHLRFIPDQYTTVITKTGKEILFTKNNGIWNSPQDEQVSLAKLDDAWSYRSHDGEHLLFNDSGRLIRQETPNSTITMTYLAGLIEVRDLSGTSLTIKEDSARQPIEVIQAGTRLTFQYDKSNRIIGITRTVGGDTKKREYLYEDIKNPSLLTGITDERGIRYATWTYDDQGRAISSEHAGGAERTLVSYNADGSSTVTNALGKRTTYRFQTIQGIRRITAIEGEPSANCPNSNSTFTYDDRGLVKTRTDNKGNVTTFDYNERGLEVSRTEAFGTPQARTITTEWHSTLFLPVTVTEPERVTNYSYGVQGKLVGQTTTQR